MLRSLDVSRPRTAIAAAAAVGLLAGLLAAAFFSVAGEPRIEDAIAIEEARASGDDHAGNGVPDEHDHGAVEVSREAQRGIGLFAAMGLAGAAFGALFGVAFTLLRSIADPLRRAVVAGALLGGSLTVVPWFKYPPNPPAVGDPDTVDRRQLLYVLLLVLALAIGAGAILLARHLHDRGLGDAARLTAVVAAVVVPLAVVLAVLPPNDDAVTVPATLIWQFRIVSLAGNALLWGTLTLGFAWLAARAGSRAQPPSRVAVHP